jgi:hypothetical protein
MHILAPGPPRRITKLLPCFQSLDHDSSPRLRGYITLPFLYFGTPRGRKHVYARDAARARDL